MSDSKKPRILFCIHSLLNGGAERVMVNTVNTIKEKTGWCIDLLLVNNQWDQELRDSINEGVTVKSIFRKETRFSRQLIKRLPAEVLHKLFIREKYDVEIAFLEGDATKIIAGGNIPKVCWVHTDMNNYRWTEKYYSCSEEEIKCYSSFDERVCVSYDVGKAFRKKTNLSYKVIINLLNPERAKQLAQGQDPFDHSHINTVSLGTLKSIKGYDRLIEAFAKADLECIPWEHHFIGSGPEEESLRDLAACYPKCHFSFEGYKANPYPWLNYSDLLVCSSKAEGFSSVVYEALVLGVPILTTDVSGMRELLGSSQYGIIVDNSLEGLVEGLEQLLKNQSKLYEYRKLSAERGNELCQKDQAQEIIAMLRQLQNNE